MDEIEKSGQFDLIALNEIFNAGDLNHKEALMVQQWSKNPGGNLSNATPKGNYYAAYFIGQYRTEIGGTAEYACSYENWGYTYGRCLPSPYLFSLYDKTKDNTIYKKRLCEYFDTWNKNVIFAAI